MKILYGICGEGFGHSSRAKEIIKHLKKQGHKILILTYGQAYPILKPIEKTIKIEGIHLIFKDNKLSLRETIKQASKSLLENLKIFKKIKSEITRFNPQLCITDMEPIVPIVSYWYNLPLISIDNQHRLTYLKIKIPKKYKNSYKLAKFAVNKCVSKANAFIILSFIKQKLENKNVFIVSPLLRKEIIKLKQKTKNFILVYLTKQNNRLINILKNFHNKFLIYGYNISKKQNNLIFKITGKNFIKDLANCKAIIASAGFTLISEALYLKKPYFTIPLQGQFEQTLNALFLKKSKLGTFSENPTLKQIQDFLNNLDKYKFRLKKYKTNPNEAISVLDKVLKHITSQTASKHNCGSIIIKPQSL